MTPDSNLGSLLDYACLILKQYSGSAQLDAQLLLCDALGKDRSYLIAWPENKLNPEQFNTFKTYLSKRKQGIPIAYILGRKEFWSLPFKVTADVLIPRPETELLVELALDAIQHRDKAEILDLGTGSGAIALAIASERPDATITATDYSAKALAIAQYNAEQHQTGNVLFLQSDWFTQLQDRHRRFDLIVSNPPYIEDNDPHLQGEIRFEPITALTSGTDGLDDIRKILAEAGRYLTPQGWLMMEHGYTQGNRVRGLFRAAGFADCQTVTDHAGNDRVTMGRLS